MTRDREDVAYWHFSEVPLVTRELDLADEHRLGPMLILRRAGYGDEGEVFVRLRRPAGG